MVLGAVAEVVGVAVGVVVLTGGAGASVPVTDEAGVSAAEDRPPIRSAAKTRAMSTSTSASRPRVAARRLRRSIVPPLRFSTRPRTAALFAGHGIRPPRPVRPVSRSAPVRERIAASAGRAARARRDATPHLEDAVGRRGGREALSGGRPRPFDPFGGRPRIERHDDAGRQVRHISRLDEDSQRRVLAGPIRFENLGDAAGPRGHDGHPPGHSLHHHLAERLGDRTGVHEDRQLVEHPGRVDREALDGHLTVQAEPGHLALDEGRILPFTEQWGADQPEPHRRPFPKNQRRRSDQLELPLGGADPPEQSHDGRVRRPAPVQVAEHLVRGQPRPHDREVANAGESVRGCRRVGDDRSRATTREGSHSRARSGPAGSPGACGRARARRRAPPRAGPPPAR